MPLLSLTQLNSRQQYQLNIEMSKIRLIDYSSTIISVITIILKKREVKRPSTTQNFKISCYLVRITLYN